MKRFTLLLVLAITLSAAGANAFNGLRKGFVLGGGLGFAPVSKFETDVYIMPFEAPIHLEEENAGFGLHLVIGYAWDEHNMIVYEGNVTSYESDFFDETMSQGFNGASWYHYFSEPGKTIFTDVGIGFYIFQDEDNDSNDPGPGLLLGFGYEFARHWQVGTYLGLGSTSNPDFDHAHLSILISTVAF